MLAIITTIVLAQANPVWSQTLTDAGLSGAERTCFAGVITARWPDATPTAVDYFHCNRASSVVGCNYKETVSGTAAQLLADQRAGRVPNTRPVSAENPNGITWNANVATYQRVRKETLTSAQALDLHTCILTVWPSAGAAQSLTIERTAGPTFPASLDHHVTGTAAQYVAALASGAAKELVQ